ncbi:hypothetical protein [Sulfurospirillum arcachonense]|uniref:hypothetical protein n=1 Tax=Sulfurospirillum arcachonense TaxID=57666 RepID=UPI000469C2CB|nr:hypothetical protein [Sulfurospirillum arcachonense]
MKRVLPYFILIIFGIFIYNYAQTTSENVYYVDENIKKEPLPVVEIKKEKTVICSDCGMMVKKLDTSAQVVTPSGRTYFFDDVGCMIRWVDKQSFKKDIKMFVFVPECSCYIDAYEAWYIRDGITPIGYGVRAYGTSMGALGSDFTFSAHEYGLQNYKESDAEKDIYEFDEVRLYVLRGETLLNPLIKKLILYPK